MSNRSRWVLGFAALSLPVTLLLTLAFELEAPAALGFMVVTTGVAGTLGNWAAGERWFLRTLVGTVGAGALYGSLVALIVTGPLFFLGTLVGAAVSLPYLPFLTIAGALAETRSPSSRPA